MNNLINKRTLFQISNNIILTLLALASILPFLLLVVSSFADEATLTLSGYSFFPEKFSLDAYKYLFQQSSMLLRAYGITLLVTVVGTSVGLLMTSMLAYPLSRKDFSKRNAFTFIVFFTMLFNGGLVPSYLMWTSFFHIKNTIFALIIPNLLLNAFNVLLMKNYYSNNIPPELIEAAEMDGAGEYKVFFKIILPLSLPIMATVGLMIGIGYWNDWTNGLYYLTDQNLFSLQNVLNSILTNIQFLSTSNVSQKVTTELPSTSVRMAIAVVGMLPILVLYPFFQRYFVKGITVGSVKG
ncbi:MULTISPECIES: carbohydrate ABC transporter permease [Paenibacillus]|uniref:carbohydrate ABC transporter permease n=1 Tax=Paenibacillus TaxID=44249 RepID=UPI00096CFFF6|nr:carbohydrate ABC transporter permease [Paenibacillus peoriae]OMF70375.1 sugar ABC transporter permease [Paenibacillus peoriae]OMF81304.1 sugar ABC transporter permease [Paenibacillus peoriae]